MIETNNKQALKELNKVVKVLDINQSFKKTAEVITKIEKKYKLNKYDPRNVRLREEDEKKQRDLAEKWNRAMMDGGEVHPWQKGYKGWLILLFILIVFLVLLNN